MNTTVDSGDLSVSLADRPALDARRKVGRKPWPVFPERMGRSERKNGGLEVS